MRKTILAVTLAALVLGSGTAFAALPPIQDLYAIQKAISQGYIPAIAAACTNGQFLSYNSSTKVWGCAASAVSNSATSLTLTSTSTTIAMNAATDFNVTNTAGGANFTTTTGVCNVGVNGMKACDVWSAESITLSTSGATTDSTANLLPANSVIKAVVCRVTTTITTATDWSVGDGTTAARFISADSTLTANETQVGLNAMKGGVSTDAAGPTQASAAKLRITTSGTPGAGVVRCGVLATVYTPPTS